MRLQSNGRRWLRRAVLFALGLLLSVAAARLLDPRRGQLAAEDSVDATIRDQTRPDAPSLDGATAWINTDKPITIADLKGKVVLLDFWTFG